VDRQPGGRKGIEKGRLSVISWTLQPSQRQVLCPEQVRRLRSELHCGYRPVDTISGHKRPLSAGVIVIYVPLTIGKMPSKRDIIERDVIVVGAGFSGCYLLKLIRDQGFSTIVLEANSRLGGVWSYNCYPGARVDSELPYYGYSDPAVWGTWNWTERFCSYEELRGYFDHVDKIWQLTPDVVFNAQVCQAAWQEESSSWFVQTADGQLYRSTWLLPATGTSFKRNVPDFKGRDKFQGIMHHSSQWPERGVDLKGKRVAVIGAGSTGVQMLQESAKVASRVVHYIRSPNLALPMRQRAISEAEIYHTKAHIPYLFKACRSTRSGLAVMNTGRRTFDDTEEQRQQLWEENWKRGGFNWFVASISTGELRLT
jgi:cation diffusion facilitator CzcD-associated flavoprotein CzcO